MARPRSFKVSLTSTERRIIQHTKRKATSDNKKTRYAIILAADENRYGSDITYEKIAAKAGASIPTVVDTLKKCTNVSYSGNHRKTNRFLVDASGNFNSTLCKQVINNL